MSTVSNTQNCVGTYLPWTSTSPQTHIPEPLPSRDLKYQAFGTLRPHFRRTLDVEGTVRPRTKIFWTRARVRDEDDGTERSHMASWSLLRPEPGDTVDDTDPASFNTRGPKENIWYIVYIVHRMYVVYGIVHGINIGISHSGF